MPEAMRAGLKIRGGDWEDADRLAVLATQVWLHTYATDGISAEIAEYVHRELTPQKFVSLLSDLNCQTFVAESGESIVGLAVIGFGAPCPAADANDCGRSTAELRTLYVSEQFTGGGIGKSLLRSAEAAAKQRTDRALWLTVNAKNARGVAFYLNQGYAKVGTSYFVLGEGRHENHVLIGGDATLNGADS